MPLLFFLEDIIQFVQPIHGSYNYDGIVGLYNVVASRDYAGSAANYGAYEHVVLYRHILEGYSYTA